MHRFACFALLLSLAFSSRVHGLEVAVDLLDGRRLEGELSEWTAAGVTIATDAGPESASAQQLLELRATGADVAGERTLDAPVVVRMRDGSVIPAEEVSVENRVMQIATPLATDALAAPSTQAQLVELKPRTEAADRVWAELQRKELPGDVLLVTKKDGAAVDYLAGVVGQVTADRVEFEWEGERIPVKRSKVAAIAFYQGSETELPPAICRLQLDSGARIAATTLRGDGERLHATTPAGFELEFPLSSVTSADYSLGKLAYLGDQQPLDDQWTPLVGLPPGATTISGYGEPRFNRGFSGQPIRLAAGNGADAAGDGTIQQYPKGVALRSRTEIAFAVPSGMSRFVTLAGIAPECAAEGHVSVTLFADRERVWEGDVAGGEPPQEIAVDLHGARRLRILVDYGENLDYGDQLHLALARFTK